MRFSPLVGFACLLLAGCTSTPPSTIDAGHLPDSGLWFCTSEDDCVDFGLTCLGGHCVMPGPDAALIQYGRNDRPGHSVLQRNQDGFLLRDLYVYPESLLVRKYASFLFPPKGYLPDWWLRQYSDLPAPPH